MPGNDSNTKLLLHANGGDGVKSAFCHMKMEDNTDEGTGANAVSNIGTPTYTSGKLNNALTLDGSTDALNLDALAADIASDTVGTFSFWVKPDDGQFYKTFGFGDTDAYSYFDIEVQSYDISGDIFLQ